MPPAVETVRIEAAETLPEDTTFDAYVAKRMEEAQNDFAAEPDDLGESLSSDPEPEPAESAPVPEVTEEKKPAAETPEPVTEPGPVDNQEEKEKEGKKQGIPQSRLDEVTKARREAERERDAEKTAREKAERELAELKAGKPAEQPKPEAETPAPTDAAPAEAPKPVAPERPTLEALGGDWNEYEKALVKFDKETYPEYVEKLTDWKQEQREVAKQKADTEKAKTAKQASEEATRKAATDAEKAEWDTRINTARQKHPDYDAVISQEHSGEPVNSPAMEAAIRGYEDAGEIIYYLASHPEESRRIAAITPHQDGLPNIKIQQLLATAHREFGKIQEKIAQTRKTETPGPATPKPAPTTSEAAPVVPPVPKPPENPKPATSRAPRPPSPVAENAGTGIKDPKDAAASGDFEAYEARRRAQTTRR